MAPGDDVLGRVENVLVGGVPKAWCPVGVMRIVTNGGK